MKMRTWKKMFKGIFSSAFAHLANAEFYIFLPSLTYLLPHIVTDLLTDLLWKKLKISVNIDAGTLKFSM